jgi:hypothetical protein
MGAIGLLPRLGFVTAVVRGADPLTGLVVAVMTLVAHRDQTGIALRGQDVPDSGGGGVVCTAW